MSAALSSRVGMSVESGGGRRRPRSACAPSPQWQSTGTVQRPLSYRGMLMNRKQSCDDFGTGGHGRSAAASVASAQESASHGLSRSASNAASATRSVSAGTRHATRGSFRNSGDVSQRTRARSLIPSPIDRDELEATAASSVAPAWAKAAIAASGTYKVSDVVEYRRAAPRRHKRDMCEAAATARREGTAPDPLGAWQLGRVLDVDGRRAIFIRDAGWLSMKAQDARVRPSRQYKSSDTFRLVHEIRRVVPCRCERQDAESNDLAGSYFAHTDAEHGGDRSEQHGGNECTVPGETAFAIENSADLGGDAESVGVAFGNDDGALYDDEATENDQCEGHDGAVSGVDGEGACASENDAGAAEDTESGDESNTRDVADNRGDHGDCRSLSGDADEETSWPRALRSAFGCRCEWIVRIVALVEQRADVNGMARNGVTPLIAAAEYGLVRVLNLLVALRADVSAETSANSARWTPLHAAAKAGRADFCRALLHLEADTEAEFDEAKSTSAGKAPRLAASCPGCGAGLVAADGARWVQTSCGGSGWEQVSLVGRDHVLFGQGLVNARASRTGSTPLLEAVDGGYTDIVLHLIRARAKVTARCDDGTTALMRAVARSDYTMCAALIHSGCPLCAGATQRIEDFGRRRVVTSSGRLCRFKCLDSHHPPIRDANGNSALSLALSTSRVGVRPGCLMTSVVRLLRAHGVQ
eukprot:TRINITY_DN49502_c0_g1_i1.p1 TRINITY_DN49502_c0_g1~~TRINITY_DN49502_c0_g1_i1.p1  ORF type:complete len:720 (+),score=93.11 TRINITY_DN49502_c0_g1_i1:62-2161(+)